MPIDCGGEHFDEKAISTGEMVRTCEELVLYFNRYNTIPQTTVLLTSRSLFPAEGFILEAGDGITTNITGVGCVENTVRTVQQQRHPSFATHSLRSPASQPSGTAKFGFTSSEHDYAQTGQMCAEKITEVRLLYICLLGGKITGIMRSLLLNSYSADRLAWIPWTVSTRVRTSSVH